VLTPKRRTLSRAVPRRIGALDVVNANADFARFVREHEKTAFIPNPPWRERIYDHVAETSVRAPISYLEFGVWKGDSLRYWASLLDDPANRFWGFDTFEGLPEDWRAGQPKGTFGLAGTIPDFDDTRIGIVPGLFQQSLDPFLAGWRRDRTQLVVHMDADLYSSTLFVLTTLDRHFVDGDVVIFDDFGVLLHEFRAFMDYTSAFKRRFEVLAGLPSFVKIAVKLGDREV
jgi:hypothetical protein